MVACSQRRGTYPLRWHCDRSFVTLAPPEHGDLRSSRRPGMNHLGCFEPGTRDTFTVTCHLVGGRCPPLPCPALILRRTPLPIGPQVRRSAGPQVRKSASPQVRKSASPQVRKSASPKLSGSRTLSSLLQLNFARHRGTMTIASVAVALERRLGHFSNQRTTTRCNPHRKCQRQVGVKIAVRLADQIEGFARGVDQRDRRTRKRCAGLIVQRACRSPNPSA